MKRRHQVRIGLGMAVVAVVGLLLGQHAPRIGAQALASPTYTAEQAKQGQAAYAETCASCHGPNLDDGAFGAPVKGSAFRQQWGSKSVEELFIYLTTRMPPASPGSLGDKRYAQ